jgi:hypothetical protein
MPIDLSQPSDEPTLGLFTPRPRSKLTQRDRFAVGLRSNAQNRVEDIKAEALMLPPNRNPYRNGDFERWSYEE